MRVHFLGANRQVTGSSYVVEAAGRRVMVDCGLFQEKRFQARNRSPWKFEPASLDALVLTHAHLDHCGLIPRLVKDGFRGPIFTHHATADLAVLVMNDSARLQENQADPDRDDYFDTEPLYTQEDAKLAAELFKTIGYDTATEIAPDVGIILHEAGHILGSASVSFAAKENGTARTIVFSGDLGQFGKPIIRDPAPPKRADLLILESTYGAKPFAADSAKFGDEDQPSPKDFSILDELERIILDAHERGGKLIIPTFAIERAQEVLYYLARLRDAKRFANIPVFLDSPMAVDATKLFRKHADLFDPAAMEELRKDGHVLGFTGLRLCDDRQDSFAINDINGTAIILAGSGMCTGGRVLHHLVRYVDEPETTVLFVGYQAQDTLGRDILEGRSPVRIMEATKEVRAKVERIDQLSGHADVPAIFRWLAGFEATPPRVYLTHGEAESAEKLAATLRAKCEAQVKIPAYGDVVEV